MFTARGVDFWYGSFSRDASHGGAIAAGGRVAAIEHVVADRAGDWRVFIVGSQANDRWEMNIAGRKGFERLYTLEGTPKEQLQQRMGPRRFFFLPYASALIPHGTASALRSSLSIECDEVEAEFPGLSSKTNLLAMLTATL